MFKQADIEKLKSWEKSTLRMKVSDWENKQEKQIFMSLSFSVSISNSSYLFSASIQGPTQLLTDKYCMMYDASVVCSQHNAIVF